MLYLVPTPIGNLRDITLRAVDVLKEVDMIACEDTRRTQKLLSYYKIEKPLVSFHEYTGKRRVEDLVNRLKEGKAIALVCDSGTPLISDPGFPLVREAIRCGIRIESLPGPSAVVTALAASGLSAVHYSFFAFLPAKSAARRKALERLSEREETLVFYESPFRLLQTLNEMKEIFGDREAVVARELTKKFEEMSRGYLSELVEKFSKKKALGEMVILVAGKGQKEVLHS
jgi:16S rRNA (cytidine1402-2'-O)-methyltransferase